MVFKKKKQTKKQKTNPKPRAGIFNSASHFQPQKTQDSECLYRTHVFSGLKFLGVAPCGKKYENPRIHVNTARDPLSRGLRFPGRPGGELGQETSCNFTAMKLAPDGSEERFSLPAGARYREPGVPTFLGS
jgi:hypothetical protein